MNDGLSAEECPVAQIFRLMPLAEVVAVHTRLQRAGIGELLKAYSMACFWTDDSSHYAGVFCDGIFAGRVFLMSAEGAAPGDCPPVFRSLDAFQNALNEAAERNRIIGYFEAGEITAENLAAHASRFPWYRHYPPETPSSWLALPLDYRCEAGEYSAGDREARSACLKLLEAKVFPRLGEREFLIGSLARLVPPEEAASLLPWLKEEHQWIPGRVAQILVQRECPEAVAPLVTLALTGNASGQAAARGALVKLGIHTPQALGAIKAEYSRQGGDYAELKATQDTFSRSPTLFYQW